MKIYHNLKILFLFLGLYFACGRNPTEPPVKPDVRTIRGNARLENQTDHYGIFVYLEGLKLYTLTDEAGNYSLTIPDSLFKNQTLTQSGNFNIYYAFYLYDLDSVQILTDNKGFIPDMKDIDGQGQVKSVILEQFLDLKSRTDKTVYRPEDTLWVEMSLTNLSNHPIEVVFYDQGMGYSISEITLYADNALWYFLAQGSFAEEREKLNPGQSLNRSCRYLLKSITEPRWRITFPWQCRIKPAGFNILSCQNRLPKKLRNVIHELGWPNGDYLAKYFSMPIFYQLLKNKFALAQITITM